MKKLSVLSRSTLTIASVLVVLTYFMPLWEIKLWAPQYPEGLSIKIWHNNVSGDVDVINGLNHYIGMRHIKAEMFPEFHVLKYIIAAFMLWGFFVAWKGTWRWLLVYCISIVIGGVIALADFYRWGYDYGHNLDPTAPIQVPGMAYQPPVLGYKELLNFMALSIPASGGWLIVGVGVIAFAILITEWMKHRKIKGMAVLALMMGLSLSVTSCMKVKPSIQFGKDDCDYCKMKLMDNHFGSALSTSKGRVYKFDDFNCYQGFCRENSDIIPEESFIISFDQPGNLIPMKQAFYMKSAEIKSPMGSGIAAFSTQDACKMHESKFHSVCVTYTQLEQSN